MQETINYNLKKPEANDNVNIDDLNLNFDIIDEKLFAVIQAWEKFKASGGEVNGPIITPTGIQGPSSCSYAFGSGNLQIKNGEARIDFISGDGVKPPRLEPLTGGDYDLGDPDYYFKNVWIGPYSKTSNGYTKLPNGVILQWGSVEARSPGVDYRVNYPIRFPNKCIAVSIENIMNVNSDKREFSRFCTWNTSMADHFAFRGEGFTNWVYPSWIAIGY